MKYLRIHLTTVLRLPRSRQIPAFGVGSELRFDSETVDRWCARRAGGSERSSGEALAATVFGNRARKGRKGNSGGSERRCLPVSFVVKHGIENNEELAHTGDERGLGVFTIGIPFPYNRSG
jgi:excisionase family DNA binding protein